MSVDRRQFVVRDAPASRLDVYLASLLDTSRSRAAQLIEGGSVLVNGSQARKRDIPAIGDRIEVEIPAPEASPIEPQDIPFEIVFQDEDLLVIDKPAGLVVHPAPGHRQGTLVNALLHVVRDLSGIGGVLRPGIVHRLDKDTSGLMLVAKTDVAHRVLAEELRQRRIRRRYLAAAWGHVANDSFTVDAPIARHPSDRKRMAIVQAGRRAVTHFRRLERWPACDLLEAQLESGRTHQIRVHLLHAGHPVVGDEVYGTGREKGFTGAARGWALELARRVPRQFLHAWEIRFNHPRTSEEMRFQSPLPDDLESVAKWARGTAIMNDE